MSTLKMKPQTLVALATFVLFLGFSSPVTRISPVGRVECTSYLGDYFLPTAKIALNKIQQSLSPSSYSSQPQQSAATVGSNQTGAADQQSAQTASAGTSSQPSGPVSVPQETAFGSPDTPKVSDFVRLTDVSAPSPTDRPANSAPQSPTDNNPVGSGSGGDQPAAPVTRLQEVTPDVATESSSQPPAVIVTSTELASDLDPTSTVASAPVEQVASSEQPAVVAVADSEAGKFDADASGSAPGTPTTSESPPPAPSATVIYAVSATQSGGGGVVESKSADEAAIRETELEAVAAVDASIGFGGDLFGSMSDSCYDEYANARFCEPEFENVAFERQVEVSSECGSPPSRFCTAYLSERHEHVRNCHICDAQHPKKRHPAAYLTDMNNSNSPTCWVSAPIASSGAPTQAGSPNGSTNGESNTRPDNVTLVLNLEKKYEIVYISMQFCSMKPDSLAIYKSMDYGRSWTPYQFYSSQCRRLYGRSSRASPPGGGRQPTGELEATCTNSSLEQSQQNSPSSARIAFSTLDGRSAAQAASSPQLQDWITATNIKIVLDRHQASWIHSNQLTLPHHLHHPQQQQQQATALGARNTSQEVATTSQQPADKPESSLTSPSDTFNYAMSDLTVGGRCKCNGHASRCIHSKEGRLQCDCRHNTAGRDCEKCAPFHFDRPWARATHTDANPCQPCNCNGHSRKCRFDAELYRMSGRRSGGVCIGCRDNTAGRFCNYCKEGFTRDHSKPMSDKEACKHCDCHPIGSLGRACNQTTGQCPCKEGVAGLQCNRCAPGYQQSSSLTDPCIKLPDNENDINYYPPLTVDGDERSTSSDPQEGAAVADQLDVEIATGAATPVGRPTKEDKEDDTTSEALDNEQPSFVRPHNPRHGSRNKPHNYYGYHPLSRQQFNGDEDEDDDDDDLANSELSNSRRLTRPQLARYDDEYLSSMGPRGSHPGMHPSGYHYYSNVYPSKSRYSADYRRQHHGRHRPDLMLHPVASVDPGVGPLEDLGNSLDDTDSFNQIQTPNLRRLRVKGGRMGPNQFNGEPPMVSATNEIVCDDCQMATRRLSWRQFCNLQFAIRATILNKYAADDWTRVELEIQDIFRSQGSVITGQQSPPARSLVGDQTNSAVDSMQADEPLSMNVNNGTSIQSVEGSTSADRQNNPHVSHRIKVGTVQSIWVPTEDLRCRCPRLKLRATYLLMGSIDAKENSVNALQLDRHGVALEWKSSLQEKLMKYQRRLARGKC